MSEAVRRENDGKWKAGTSGNPGGRTKEAFAWMEEIRRLEPKALAVWERALNQVVGKDRRPTGMAMRAADGIIAYSRGKPVQPNVSRVIHSLQDLSTDELERLLAEGEKPAIEGIAEPEQ